MPSSTSSSESEPVFHRRIPGLSWPRVAVLAAVLAVAGVGAWEAYWRVAQQYEASYRNSDGQWAETRRSGRPESAQRHGVHRLVAHQFDIDLDVAGRRRTVHGVQLALEGSNPMPILTHIAEDEDFAGLLVVGVTPPLVFYAGNRARAESAVQHDYRDETPSQWMGQKLSYPLETRLASYTFDTKLVPVLAAARAGGRSGRGLPWRAAEVRKIGTVDRGRPSRPMWNRVENDPEYNEIVTWTWQASWNTCRRSAARRVAQAAFEALLETGGGRRREDPGAWRRGRVHPAAVQRLVPRVRASGVTA